MPPNRDAAAGQAPGPEFQKPDIWMPLFIGELLADTCWMDAAQFRAYVHLLCAYWNQGGPLEDVDECLANISRMTLAEWQESRGALARLFQVGGGFWRHERQDRELAKAIENKKRRRAQTQAATLARTRNATTNVTKHVT